MASRIIRIIRLLKTTRTTEDKPQIERPGFHSGRPAAIWPMAPLSRIKVSFPSMSIPNYMARRLRVGTPWIPWGGYKSSGIGLPS